MSDTKQPTNETPEPEHLRAATTDAKAIEAALNRINSNLGLILAAVTPRVNPARFGLK
jgi:hypothetical protein